MFIIFLTWGEKLSRWKSLKKNIYIFLREILFSTVSFFKDLVCIFWNTFFRFVGPSLGSRLLGSRFLESWSLSMLILRYTYFSEFNDFDRYQDSRFWERGQQAFLDLKVFDSNACRYRNNPLQQCHVIIEQEKKRTYNKRILWPCYIYTSGVFNQR